MLDPDKLHTNETVAPDGPLAYAVYAVGLTALLTLLAVPLIELSVR